MFEYSAIQGTRGTIGIMLLYGEAEEVEDRFYQVIRMNIKMELEKNGFKVKEVFEPMLDANAPRYPVTRGLSLWGTPHFGIRRRHSGGRFWIPGCRWYVRISS